MSTQLSKNFAHLTYPPRSARLAHWAKGEVRRASRGQPLDPLKWNSRRGSDLSVVLPNPPLEDMTWVWGAECLVQDHVLDLLNSSGFTGFMTKPVKARDKKATAPPPPRLWELVVTGWGGMAAKESGIEMIGDVSPIGGFTQYSGLANPEKLIDPKQWDGSDFFMVWPLPAFIFVTRRVVDALKKAKLSGFRIVEIADLERSKGYSPGVLSHWMPAEIAKQRGEKSGIIAI